VAEPRLPRNREGQGKALVYGGRCHGGDGRRRLRRRASSDCTAFRPSYPEGNDPDVEKTFRDIARLTRGAYCRFNAGRHELRELLRAVAAMRPAA